MTLTIEPPSAAALGSDDLYRCSGRVAWLHFGPMAAVSIVTTFVMAYALHLAEQHRMYGLFITPAVLCLPVLAAILLSIYVGRCRNVLLAGSFGVLLMTFFYVGFWEFSYYFNVVTFGPVGVKTVEEIGGAPGLLGYFMFRMKSDTLAFDDFGRIALMTIGRLLELGCLVATGLYTARRVAGRVYYEDHAKWASSRAFVADRAMLPALLACVRTLDWSSLRSIDKGTPTREQRLRGAVTFRAEYLPHSSDQPVYISVESAFLRRPRILLILFPFLGAFVRRWIRQRIVPAESARELARYFGGVELALEPPSAAPPIATPAAADASQPLRYWSADQQVQTAPSEGALGSLFNETGLKGTTFIGRGVDFRSAASRESISLLEASPNRCADGVASSLCWPARENAVRALKWASIPDILLSFGFVLGVVGYLAGGFIVRGLEESGSLGTAQLVRSIRFASGVLAISTLLMMLFAFRSVQTWVLSRFFVRRPGNLLAGTRGLSRQVIRIEDSKTFHVSKLYPEDWTVCVFDAQRNRLLIEGVSHRYVIRGRDVSALRVIRNSSSIAVEIVYRIGAEELAIVLCRYAMGHVVLYGLQSQPLIGALLRKPASIAPRRFARYVASTLGIDPSIIAPT